MTRSLGVCRVVLSGGAALAAAALAHVAPAAAQPGDPPVIEDAAQPEDAPGEAAADPTPGVDAAGAVAAGAVASRPMDAPADTPAAGVTTGYEKGFYIRSADDAFSLATQARVQGRYTFESADAGDVRDEESNFAIQRARLSLGGHAFTRDVKYKFQSDFGKGEVTLKDFYVDWKLGGSSYVRVGQYKRPFSRQQINSSGSLELVDRAITDKAFKAGRDIGVMLHNNYEKSPRIEWAIGVFNATGDGAVPEVDPDTGITEGFSNVPALFGPAIVVRGGYNTGGIKGYSEADLEGGPLRLGVGASVLAELDADDDDQSAVRAEADFVVKVQGLSATGGVYVATAQDDAGFFDQAYALLGLHLQGGYMLTDKHQLSARYAMLAPDGADDMLNEVTAGFSFYQFKHGLKWQTDVGVLIEGEARDFLGRSQLQLAF